MSVPAMTDEARRLAVVRSTGLPEAGADLVLDRLAHVTARVLGARVAFVGLSGEESEVFAGAVAPPAELGASRASPLELAVGALVIEGREPLVAGDARLDLALSAGRLLPLGETFACLGHPLWVDEEVVGALCVVRAGVRPWSADDLATVADVATVAATTLARRSAGLEAERTRHDLARQRAALEQEADDEASLLRVAGAVARTRGVGRLCAMVAEEAAHLMRAPHGSVVRFAADSDPVVLEQWPREKTVVRETVAEDAAVWPVVRSGRVAHGDDLVAAPVRRGGEIWGAVVSAGGADREFAPRIEARFVRLAELLEVALANADARAALAADAATDHLTGLANRRALRRRLDERLEHARRSHDPLSLILFDVDRLKAINDSLGHAAGDRALVRVARCAETVVRRGELLGRLGGDEFALILPDTDVSQAHTVAARLCRAVAGATGDDDIPALSVSVGVARSVPGQTGAELLAAADRALYGAKGRRGDGSPG